MAVLIISEERQPLVDSNQRQDSSLSDPLLAISLEETVGSGWLSTINMQLGKVFRCNYSSQGQRGEREPARKLN